jgi:hypothetical protein
MNTTINTAVIGKFCVIRCSRAGVFAGTVEEMDGQTVLVRNVRKLWRWYGATETMQIALEGVKRPRDCRFTVSVDSLVLTDAIEVTPATEAAKASIDGVKVWKI